MSTLDKAFCFFPQSSSSSSLSPLSCLAVSLTSRLYWGRCFRFTWKFGEKYRLLTHLPSQFSQLLTLCMCLLLQVFHIYTQFTNRLHSWRYILPHLFYLFFHGFPHSWPSPSCIWRPCLAPLICQKVHQATNAFAWSPSHSAVSAKAMFCHVLKLRGFSNHRGDLLFPHRLKCLSDVAFNHTTLTPSCIAQNLQALVRIWVQFYH